MILWWAFVNRFWKFSVYQRCVMSWAVVPLLAYHEGIPDTVYSESQHRWINTNNDSEGLQLWGIARWRTRAYLLITFHVLFILPKFALSLCPFCTLYQHPHQLYRHKQGFLYVLRFTEKLIHLNSCNLCVTFPTRLAYVNLWRCCWLQWRVMLNGRVFDLRAPLCL